MIGVSGTIYYKIVSYEQACFGLLANQRDRLTRSSSPRVSGTAVLASILPREQLRPMVQGRQAQTSPQKSSAQSTIPHRR